MKYFLLLLIVAGMVGCKNRTHKGFCLTCPDTCVAKFFNGVNYNGKMLTQTMTCDCADGFFDNKKFDLDSMVFVDTTSGLDYKWNMKSGVTSLEGFDGSIGDLHPKASPSFSKLPIDPNRDTIYVYRDTCVGLGASSYHQEPSYFLEHTENSVFIRDTIYHDSQYRIYPNGFPKDTIKNLNNKQSK